ncbi:MAG TPA: alpha/beta fold hydrolase [Anaerolineae bacterium]|nr:alpha/beta fold hydrolase [Anaerolineae bacterium]
MTVLRFLGNLLLAIVLILVIASTLFTASAIVLSETWEELGLDDGVEDGTWAWIDEQPIYYKTLGPEEGPLAVLVHGFYVEGSQTWEGSVEALTRSGIRVIAVDLKGFGHSARDTSPAYTLRNQAILLAKLLNQLHVGGATVVAHGWGASVALQLASEQPQFVGQLALVAPVVYQEHIPLWEPVARVPYLGSAAAWCIDSGGPLWTLLRRHGFYDKSAVTGTYLADVRRPTYIVGTIEALLAMARSPKDSDLPKAIADIEVPTLILLGGEDPWVPIEDAQRLKRDLGDARLVIIPEAGHYVHIEQSLQVNRHLAEFCAQSAR